MALFWQTLGGVLIALILWSLLSSRSREGAVLLSLAVCTMVLLAAVNFLKPVVELIHTLADSAQLDTQLLQTLLKAVGIGLIAELAGLLCADSGNGTLGRAIEMVAAAAVLWLCIPLITRLLELVQQMAGGV